MKIVASLALLASGGALLAASAVGGPARKEGGTLRIALPPVASLDPAIAYGPPAWFLLDATCARLMRTRDLPPPAGYRIVPEAAAGYRVLDGGRTFVFTLRTGAQALRFNDGSKVTAESFERAINRLLAPAMRSPAVDLQYVEDLVGADAVVSGQATMASGVVARGNKLTVRFTEPAFDFPARTTMPFFCAVPASLPVDAEGVDPIPGAGPFYVQSFVRGRQITLARNPHYRGKRPHHLGRIVVEQTVKEEDPIDRIKRNALDWVWPCCLARDLATLKRKYGVNRARFFVKPGHGIRPLPEYLPGPLPRQCPAPPGRQLRRRPPRAGAAVRANPPHGHRPVPAAGLSRSAEGPRLSACAPEGRACESSREGTAARRESSPLRLRVADEHRAR